MKISKKLRKISALLSEYKGPITKEIVTVEEDEYNPEQTTKNIKNNECKFDSTKSINNGQII